MSAFPLFDRSGADRRPVLRGQGELRTGGGEGYTIGEQKNPKRRRAVFSPYDAV
jgi:hypothetical protein